MEQQFYTLADVAEILNISSRQAYALVRSGLLPAIRVGDRGHYRVGKSKLQEYINSAYNETQQQVLQRLNVAQQSE